jgi:inner membrane protein
MDTLTHALSGALLARATWSSNTARIPLRQQTQVGFLAAAFPDIDYILQLVNNDFLVYLNYHRGITHSLILLPLWALLLTLLLSKIMRPIPEWRSLFALCCLCLGIHIAGDVITSYGTMILAPFSDWRASLDLTFIIDFIFTGILLLGLSGSIVLRSKQLAARTGLAVLLAYIGLQSWGTSKLLPWVKMPPGQMTGTALQLAQSRSHCLRLTGKSLLLTTNTIMSALSDSMAKKPGAMLARG